jgi:hypothetical protein
MLRHMLPQSCHHTKGHRGCTAATFLQAYRPPGAETSECFDRTRKMFLQEICKLAVYSMAPTPAFPDPTETGLSALPWERASPLPLVEWFDVRIPGAAR